jgi:DNA-binding transcriptional MerR regulator
MFTSGTISKLLKVSRETIRAWSVEFHEYLSPGATPGNGRQRIFSESDLRVLSLIAIEKGRGALFADIHLALRNGQRAEPPVEFEAIVPDTSPEPRALTLRKEVERLQMALSLAMEDGQRKAGEIATLRSELDAAKKEIRELYKEIGRLEAGRGGIG